MSTFILSPAGHRACIHYGSARVEAHKAHNRYVVIDPYVIRDKLMVEGFTMTQLKFNRRGNIAYVGVQDSYRRFADSHGDRFNGMVRFKFDHRGKGAILGAVGALRFACNNQFLEPCLRIHHCSPEAQRFAADPAWFVRNMLNDAMRTVQKLDSLRGVWNGQVLLSTLPIGKTLRQKVYRASCGYRNSGVPQCLDMWGAMQALTQTRSPSLNRLASELLGNHFNTLVLGDVPQLN